MKIKNDFKLREICGEYVVTAEGMQAVDFTKLISLNETAAFSGRRLRNRVNLR